MSKFLVVGLRISYRSYRLLTTKSLFIAEKGVKVESVKKHVGELTPIYKPSKPYPTDIKGEGESVRTASSFGPCAYIRASVEFLKKDSVYRLGDKIFVKLTIFKLEDTDLTLVELGMPFYFECEQFIKIGSRLFFDGYVIRKGRAFDSLYLEFTINPDKFRTPILED